MLTGFCRYTLRFKAPAKTSRETLHEKTTYYIKVWDPADPSRFGIGECALFRGLSADDREDYEQILSSLCTHLNASEPYDISSFSSIKFGLETALLDYENGCRRTPFPSDFTEGRRKVRINGLVWMGTADEMLRRADEKIALGFKCLKFKVGGVDFNDELRIIDRIRCQYPPEQLEIRLDANGAFTPDNAMERLRRLSVLDIHSIEQPIRQKQWDAMAWICENSPIPVALDEELIGVDDPDERRRLLYYISPSYIILKPSLCGGFSGATDWIERAEAQDIGWWGTSALESDIGLNAIAQWTAAMSPSLPQGLGTGALYTNNFTSPLCLHDDMLGYDPAARWIFPDLQWSL